MALLEKTRITTRGSLINGITVELSSFVRFWPIDKQLELDYCAQAFIYDEDFGSDFIIPVLNNIYCNNNIVQVEDRPNGGDDLLFTSKLDIFKPSESGHELLFSFELQKPFLPESELISEETKRALQDEEDGLFPDLELRGVIILTNRLNGLIISRSNLIKIPMGNNR